MAEPIPIPYCGRPPDPALIWHRWNLDPVLIIALALVAALYVAGARASGAKTRTQASFYAGWAIVAGALVSPLCALSVSLFEARVGQHMILTLAAAPLVALGRPLEIIPAAFLHGRRPKLTGPGAAKTSIVAAGLFAVLIWYWHTPVPYEFTFESVTAYWLMHLTLLGSAFWLWSALLVAPRRNVGWTVAAGLFSTVQMGLLGALITLCPRAIYLPHQLTTYAWGLTPLEDQQLGGAIMWVPGCAVFLAAAMTELWRLLSEADKPQQGAAGAVAR